MSTEADLFYGDYLQLLTSEIKYKEALEKIVSWSEDYPVTVFPEPDLKKAHELLQASGISLDAISASCMRHVVVEAGRIAREALKENE